MTYDVVLASRGWGVDEFKLATPEFLRASRWYVMAERMVPVYREAETTLAMDGKNLEPKARLQLAKARVSAAAMIDDWRPYLFPEDDDGIA